MKDDCSKFLLSQKSDAGTYNYFVGKDTYADDLDDTALAYLAMHSHDKNLFTLEDAQKFVLALINCEVKEGGPYTTWLSSNYPQEVDIAVNVNIARALEVHDIVLPSLTAFIEEHIKANDLKSPYYTSSLFTCYFLSHLKNLSQESKKMVGEHVLSLRKGTLWENTLLSALSINALINLEAPYKKILEIIDALGKELKTKEIGDEAICLDPAEKSRQKYCGSKGVTAALLLEIHKYRHQYILNAFLDSMRERNWNVEGLTGCIIPEFTELAFCFHDSLKKKVYEDKELIKITLLYLQGILAYDIFDNIYDEGKDLAHLPLALDLLGYMSVSFEKLGYVRKIIDDLILETNKGMAEEKSKVKSDDLYPGRKSIGFALPCFLLLSKLGMKDSDPEWKELHQFFLHFLTARALHDDMLDFEKDKEANHPNAVADLIDQKPDIEMTELTNTCIRNHTLKAQTYLDRLTFIEPNTYLHHLLKRISIT